MNAAVRSVVATFFLLLLVSISAIAQFETATIVGTVRDVSGAVVPGTTVTLTNTATGLALQRTTEADGTYEFLSRTAST